MGRTYRVLLVTFKLSAVVMCVVFLFTILVTFLQQMKFQALSQQTHIFDQWWVINQSNGSPPHRSTEDPNITTVFTTSKRSLSSHKPEVQQHSNLTLPSLAKELIPLTLQDVHSVRRFVFFVGYPRSGHSIVASMLDAHPNMIIAHEYNLFRELPRLRRRGTTRDSLYNQLYRNSYNNALKGWRSEHRVQKGYTLQMGETWQGSFEKLLVIGEKSGAVTAQQYANSQTNFSQLYQHLQRLTGVPVRVIHVVRNPFDMISTRLLYSDCDKSRSKLNATQEHKYRHISHLQQHINRSFVIAEHVQQILTDPQLNLTVLNVHNIDFIEDTKTIMQQLCWFIGIQCSEEYLQMCSEKAYSSVSRTRHLVEWPPRMVKEVEERMLPYRHFWRYGFNRG